jgi:hypothetical protein
MFYETLSSCAFGLDFVAGLLALNGGQSAPFLAVPLLIMALVLVDRLVLEGERYLQG